VCVCARVCVCVCACVCVRARVCVCCFVLGQNMVGALLQKIVFLLPTPVCTSWPALQPQCGRTCEKTFHIPHLGLHSSHNVERLVKRLVCTWVGVCGYVPGKNKGISAWCYFVATFCKPSTV
jgi:hypothetical protein